MRNRQTPLLPPTTPLLLVRATRLRIGLRFGRKTVQNHTSPFNYEGRRCRGNDVGPTRQLQQPNCDAFSISIYYFITWPGRLLQLQPSSPSSTSIIAANFIPRHLQLQPSSPSTSILVANFIPRCQLQPSLPSAATLVAFQFPNLVAFLFTPHHHDGSGVLDADAAR
jgi:hypothetical protein